MTNFRHHVKTTVSYCVKMSICIRILMDICSKALYFWGMAQEMLNLLLHRTLAPKDI